MQATEAENCEKAKSISSKTSSSSSSSESESEETEPTTTDDIQKSVAAALLNAETKSNSSKISLESEKEEVINESPNNDSENNLPQITIESPVPDVKLSESEANVEKLPSIEQSESEQSKSSSSQSESENEAEDKYESENRSLASKPVSPDNKSIDESVVKSLETEKLTNGDTHETTANSETGIDNSSVLEKVLSKEVQSHKESDETSDSSDDEANEEETEGTEIEKVSKAEVQSYAQLVTPAGYGGGNDGYGGGDDGGYGGDDDGGYGGGDDGGYDGGDYGGDSD